MKNEKEETPFTFVFGRTNYILLVVGIGFLGDESVDKIVVIIIWGMFAFLTILFLLCVIMVVRQLRMSPKDDNVQTDMSYTLDDADEKK